MNHEEAVRLLTTIQKAYRRYFKEEFDNDTFEFEAKMWHRSLAEYTWAEAAVSFEIWMNTEKFPPTLAEFKALIAKQHNPQAFISPEKAWETVNSAVIKFGWNNELKAFATFTEPIKRAIRNIGGWQKICQTELGRDWDNLRRNFIASFQDFGIDQKEQELLPPQILRRLQEFEQEQKKLGEAE